MISRTRADSFLISKRRFAGRLLAGTIMTASCARDGEPKNVPDPVSAQSEPKTAPAWPVPRPAAPPSPPPQIPATKTTPGPLNKGSKNPKTLEEAVFALREEGFGPAADILERRVAQEKPKMRLSAEEGKRAAIYLLSGLQLPNLRKLAALMPKTAIELARSMHERGVAKADAEAMAAYLFELRESLKMENPLPFDENNSHCIGREWHEIDYSGEGMSWQDQKRFYAARGVADFKKPEHLVRFFELESKMPYFKKLYRPRAPSQNKNPRPDIYQGETHGFDSF